MNQERKSTPTSVVRHDAVESSRSAAMRREGMVSMRVLPLLFIAMIGVRGVVSSQGLSHHDPERHYRLAIEGAVSVLPEIFPQASAGSILVELDSTVGLSASQRQNLDRETYAGREVVLAHRASAETGCSGEAQVRCPAGGYPFILRISFRDDPSRGLVQVSACLEHRGVSRSPDAPRGCREVFFTLRTGADGSVSRATPVMIRGEPRTKTKL